MDDQFTQQAMQIILHAGEARNFCKEAIEALSQANIDKAARCLREARSAITEAHHVQTDVIQSEARGETLPYSVLFAHAQDTLMTVNSEINISKNLLKVFVHFDERLRALESQIQKES